MIYIKHEKANAEVTDYYLDTIELAIKECGQKTISFKEWNDVDLKKTDYVVVSTAPDAFKMFIKGIPYIFWAQGVWPEESFLRNKSQIRFKITGFIEKTALKHSKFVFVVSNKQKEFYEQKYKITISNYYVMPCSNEELHESQFFNSKKYENNVFVYAGAMSVWQCVEETICLYSEIEKKCKNAKLLLLVKDKEKALQFLQKYDVKNYDIDYVPIKELPNKLSEVKYGLLLRKDSPINNVATPTKLMTYLANGIIPIYSNCLLGVCEIMNDTKFKIALDSNDDSESIIDSTTKSINCEEILNEYRRIYYVHYKREEMISQIKKSLKALQLF